MTAPSAALVMIAAHGVGFTQVGGPWQLLGSGTLITDGSVHAILTSSNVAAMLPDAGRVGITLRSDLNQITIPRDDLSPGGLLDRADLSDNIGLSVISLSREATRRIGAVQRFYDLSRSPGASSGPWLIQGFIDELVVTDLPLDCFDLIYSFDSVVLPVESTSESHIACLSKVICPTPAQRQGLRGGGVWQIDQDERGRAFGVTLRGVVLDAMDDSLVSWAPWPGSGLFRI